MGAKEKNTSSGIGFIIVVLIALYVLAQGVKDNDKDFEPIPPSTPTDVGTLKP